METAYNYLVLSAMLTVLMWVPYILARVFVWGLPTFLSNYPENYPVSEPQMPLWSERAKRAHLNMVETLPAFGAVVLAAGLLGDGASGEAVAQWAAVFFFGRILHAVVYTLGVPYLRTPTYLASWAAVLMIGVLAIS